MTEGETTGNGSARDGGPETAPKPLSEKAVEKLNENIVKLGTRLEAMNLAQYIELTNKPLKMVWVNFLSGLARGVGMFLGAGAMGALAIAIITALTYYLLNFFNMIPVIGEISKVVMNVVKDFVATHKK